MTLSPPPRSAPQGGGRTGLRRALIVVLALAFIALFLALGTWQVQRRAWKVDLIDRVEQRVHAAPVAVPTEPQWPAVTAARDEYRRVQVSGHFLHGKEALVQASTDLGAGFWVMTPLQRDDGGIVFVNRGFVPPERRAPASRGTPPPEGPVTVTGLLRITEPGGGFLRSNAPAEDRWYSRDVAAIGAARGLDRVAPFFVDADASPSAAGQQGAAWPVGGLTVIAFPNSHLVYAITWFTLALLTGLGAWRVLRDDCARAA